MRDVRMKGFLELTRVDEALRRYFNEVKFVKPQSEEVEISRCSGRILSENIHAECDLPPFDRSTMDGYAVRSVDTFGASVNNPVVLRVVGTIETGSFPDVSVERFEAARISTGAPLPMGTDSVVMLEYTSEVSGGKIEVYRSVTPNENVSKKGEDVKIGDKILEEGTVLQPQDVAMLTAIGRRRVKVLKRLKIAVLSTGNELVKSAEEVEKGKIIDVNRPALMSAIEKIGCEPLDLGIAHDNLEEVKSEICEGLRQADLVLVSGGASVGVKDLTSDAVNQLGKPGVIIHGIAMRPGMPTALAAVDSTPLILLPGNPVAALISFHVFVKPIVTKILGTRLEMMRDQVISARISRKVASRIGLRTFLRVIVKRVDDDYVAEPIRLAGSSIISSLVKANGLIVIPEWKEGLEEDEEVEVVLLRHLEEAML